MEAERRKLTSAICNPQSEFTLSIAARCAIVKGMDPLKPRWTDDDLNTYALTTASAAAGCALGILFGRGMSRTSANIAALSLLATGALIAAPSLTEIINRVANRPASARGSRKRLEGIRNGSVPAEGAEIYALDEGV
jgi:hypothetical protein